MSDKKTVDRSQSVIMKNTEQNSNKQTIVESLNKSTSYGFINSKRKDTSVSNAKDVLEQVPHWAERYPQLTESLEGKAGSAYTKEAADSAFVTMFATMQHLEESMDDISNSGSSAFKTLKLLNKTLKGSDLSKYISESTSSNVGTGDINNPAYSVIDMVGIFYPGSVLHHLTDVMPLPQKWNKVFRIMPRYGMSANGVTAGEIVFQQFPSNGPWYASIFNTVAVTPGSTAVTLPIQPGSVSITFQADNGGNTFNILLVDQPTIVNGSVYPSPQNGKLIEVDSNGALDTSTVVYDNNANAGSITFTLAAGWTLTAPATTVPANYNYNYQQSDFNNTDIRTLGLTIETVDITAEAHPLRIIVSTELEFEMKSLADTSAISALQQTSVGLISVERDLSYIANLNKCAVSTASLTFDATPSQYYPVASKFRNFELILNEVDALIRQTIGRGTLTTVVVGRIGRNVAMMCPTFQPAKSESNIGPVLFGTLRDGEISLIYNPYQQDPYGQNVTGTFLAYFKGYGAGDAPVLMGDWLPFYITPEMQMYDLNNYQAFASFYQQQINPWVVGGQGLGSLAKVPNGGYVWQGTIVGYSPAGA